MFAAEGSVFLVAYVVPNLSSATAAEGAQRGIAVPLSVILKIAPELGPAGFGRTTEENFAALGRLFVDDAERVCVLPHQPAGNEVCFDERSRKADDDQSLR